MRALDLSWGGESSGKNSRAPTAALSSQQLNIFQQRDRDPQAAGPSVPVPSESLEVSGNLLYMPLGPAFNQGLISAGV